MKKQRKFLQKILTAFYKLTGVPVNQTSAEISNSFVTLLTKLTIAKFFVMMSSILAGKLLGAGIFGILALILAIGNFWYLPFFTSWGLAYVNLASHNENNEPKAEFLSSSLILAIISIVFWIPLLFVYKAEFAKLLNIHPEVWVWGCLFGVLMGGYYFSKNTLQANQDWSAFATCELLFAGTMITGIAMLFLIHPAHKFEAVISVFIVAHLVGSCPALFKITKKVCIPQKSNFVKTARYGFALTVSFSFSLIAMQLDKIFLNNFANSEAVGRYQAYYISTFSLINGFTTILNNYLLPLYGKYDKKKLRKIIMRFLMVMSVPLCLFCLFIGRIAFLIFGKSFHFCWGDLIWASFFSIVMFWLQITVFFSITLGAKALLSNTVIYVVFIAVQFIVMPFLIQHSGVPGAFQGMTISCAASLCILLGMLPYFLKSYNETTLH